MYFSNHICYTMSACAEDRATLESDPSAAAGTVWLWAGLTVISPAQLLECASHTVSKAINSLLALH
jgi:hypothetical protein